MLNTEFLSNMVEYAETFVDVIIKHPEGTDKFEEQIQKYINGLLPEEQSNLLFMIGMLIMQLSMVENYEDRTAVAASISIVRTMNEEYTKIQGGNFVKALTFGIVTPILGTRRVEKKEPPVQ
jgi:hypothetical protein